jgi:hypothetical protein
MALNPRKSQPSRSAGGQASSQRHASIDFEPPKLFKVLRNFLIIGVAIAVASVVYTLYWFMIATNLKDAVTNWISDRAEQGITASFNQIEISGFPTKFKVVLTEPKLQTLVLNAQPVRELGGEKWFWQGRRVVAEMKPWNFNKFNVDLSGSHILAYENQGGIYRFEGEVQQLVMDATIFSDGWPEKLDLEIAGLNLTEVQTKAVFSTTAASIVSRRLFPGEARLKNPAKTPTFSLKAKLSGIQLPTFLQLPLGHNLKELKTEFKIIGNLALSGSVQNLADWRDEGGIIEVGLLEGIYGKLKIHAAGTIALDKDLQPLIAISAKFQGFFSSINTLKKAGYIRSGDAAMAKLVLGVLSRRVGKGERSISLPLTLQDGQLSAGPVPLMAVQAIDWGEDPPPPKEVQDGIQKLGQ